MASSLPRKQRKRAAQAPWHVKHKALAAHVDPELRKKYKWSLPRSLPRAEGKDHRRGRAQGQRYPRGAEVPRGTVTGEGVKIKKTEEKEVARPLPPSNLIILGLDESDPRRRKKLTEGKE